MKIAFSILTGLLFTINLFGQDSIPKTKLPIGIYVTEKEFVERKPSITKPFKIVPDIEIRFDKDNEKNDTIKNGLTYQFLDSTTKLEQAIFGVSDGTDMYVPNKEGLKKFEYVGKFSFFTLVLYEQLGVHPLILLTNPFSLATTLIVAASTTALSDAVKPVSIASKVMLIFYNKKGKSHEATGQAIGWLLKDDKDFLQEFNAEKKYNNEVFKKYLMKMNERYPK